MNKLPMQKKIVLKKIGIAKELESPENPGALEKRVALNPGDVQQLIDFGCEVFLEKGAGEGIGYSDSSYEKAGAFLQEHEELYSEKDLLLKFKGPALGDIDLMKKGTVLFCMLHANSFPDRVTQLKGKHIIPLAMEAVYESPKHFPDDQVLGKICVQKTLESLDVSPKELNIFFLGYSIHIESALKRPENRFFESLSLCHDAISPKDIGPVDKSCLFFYDSKAYKGNNETLEFIKEHALALVDFNEFILDQGKVAIREYRESHEPPRQGGRKINCLHETGRAGCRYGFTLAKEVSKKITHAKEAKVVVLGFGL